MSWRGIVRSGALFIAALAARPAGAQQPPPERPETRVAPLIAKLRDPDTRVNAEAAKALVALGKPAVPHLITALTDKSDRARWRAAEALGAIGDLRAVGPLIERLSDDGFVAQRARAALVRIGAPAVPALLRPLGRTHVWRQHEIIRVLTEIGDLRAVPPLIGVLVSRENPGRAHAAHALGRLKAKKAVSALITALGDKEYFVVSAAVEALGEIGDRRAVAPLIQVLKSHFFDIRGEAATALGKLGDRRAVAPLAKLLAWQPPTVTREMLDAQDKILGLIPNPTLRATTRAAARYGLETMRYHDRVRAARALGEIGGPEAVRPLVNAVDDVEMRVRLAAVRALGRTKQLPALNALVAVALDRPPRPDRVRHAAAETLAQAADPRTAAALIGLLNNKDGWVDRHAREALTRIGRPAVAPLGKVLLDRDQGVRLRVAAARSLGTIGGREAVVPLDRAMRAGEAGDAVAEAATKALAKIGGQNAVEPLIHALRHGHAERAAAKALGEIGDLRALRPLIDAEAAGLDGWAACALMTLGKPAVPGVVNALADPDPAVRQVAARVLAHTGDASVVPALIAALAEKRLATRLAAAEGLSRIGDRRAVPALIKALGDRSWPARELRAVAVSALGRMPDRKAVPALIQALRDDDWEIRCAAAGALAAVADPRAVAPLARQVADREWWKRTGAPPRPHPPCRCSDYEDPDAPCEAAADALVALGSPEAKAALARLLKHPDESVRSLAQRAIERAKQKPRP